MSTSNMPTPWLNWCALLCRPTHEADPPPTCASTRGDVLRRHSVGDHLYERLYQGPLSAHRRILSPLSGVPSSRRSDPRPTATSPARSGLAGLARLTASATGQKHALPACHFATPSDGGTGLAPRAGP